MKHFAKYKQRRQPIARRAEQSGGGLGRALAWLMIAVGVVVTGVQTHALARNGMRGSLLYAAWLDIAAWLPVLLLEGTALSLILGRLYWFKGTEQRKLGHAASFVIWGCLAFNTVVQFTISN